MKKRNCNEISLLSCRMSSYPTETYKRVKLRHCKDKLCNPKLKWLPKKNIYIAAEEIYQFTINKRNKYR